MKNIGIYGLYYGQSLGDHYILDGIINQLNSRFDEELDITVFTYSPEETIDLIDNSDCAIKSATPKSRHRGKTRTDDSNDTISDDYKQKMKEILDSHPNLWFGVDPVNVKDYKFWNKRRAEIKNLDILIFGGGNILMDLYPYTVPFHYLYSKLSNVVRTPSIYYSVGAGPFQSFRGKFYFNKSLQNINTLTTRDTESLELIKDNLRSGGVEMELAADPALWLNSINSPKSEDSGKTSLDGNGIKIAASLVPYYKKGYWANPDNSKYKEYISAMTDVSKSIIEEKEAELSYFATNYPNDMYPAKDVVEKLDNNESTEIIEEKMTGEELVTFLSKYDAVLCTRLHSLIPTFVAGTPFISFAYQPKVQYFCNRIGYPEKAIDLDLSNDKILEKTNKELYNSIGWGGEIPGHEQKLKELRKYADRSLDLVEELVEKND